jgi:DNA polymerase III alpha subunit
MRIRTGFSFRSAVGHLPDVLARVAEIGWTKAPISDRASTFGFTRWTKLCKKAGIEPVYGVELAVVPTLGEKKPITDYWTFFAIDSLRPLHDLIARATLNPDKEPTLTYAEALDTPGLIKIAGERVFPDLILKARGDEDFYIGLSPSLPKALFKKLKDEGHQFIAVSDNVYTRATDREFYRVSLGRRSFTQTYPQHILADEEWVQSVSRFTNDYDRQFAINNRNDVMRLCKAKQKRAELFEPEKPFTLREMCEAGAKRVGLDLSQEVYSARLEKELRLIEEKNFGSYFYIIADLVSWAKERMIVGPARGSSCGSLVCYLLDITTIDPNSLWDSSLNDLSMSTEPIFPILTSTFQTRGGNSYLTMPNESLAPTTWPDWGQWDYSSPDPLSSKPEPVSEFLLGELKKFSMDW